MNGPMTSDPEVCPLIDILATSGGKALTAIRDAWSEVRGLVWKLADRRAPDAGGQVTVDLDGVLVVAHSDKQDAAPIWKKTYGHHPLRGSSATGRAGPANPSPLCSAPGTRARTPSPATLRPSTSTSSRSRHRYGLRPSRREVRSATLPGSPRSWGTCSMAG